MLDLQLSCIWCQSEERNHSCTNPFVLFATRSANHKKHFVLRKETFDPPNGNAGSIFYLKQGVVRVDLGFALARTAELIYPGQFFTGELLCKSGLNGRITGAADSFICEVSSDSLRRFLNEGSTHLSALMGGYALCMARFRESLYEQTFVSLKARFIKAIYRDLYYRGQDYQGELVATRIFTHEDWARCLGARRESVSRLFKDFEKRGLLRATETHIHLPDPEAFKSEVRRAHREPEAPQSGSSP